MSYIAAIYSENRGEDVVFGSGFAHIWVADFVCRVDADRSYGPEHFLSMVGEVKVCAADVIVACPYHPEGSVEGVQPWRLTLSKQCSRLYRMALLLKLYGYTNIFGSTVGLWCMMFGSRVTISSRPLRSYWVRLLRVIASPRCRSTFFLGQQGARVEYYLWACKLLVECLLAGQRALRRPCACKRIELIYA